MAIGTTFDTLQAAILAEEAQKQAAVDSFRNYLVRQSANANQGRQVGVNQFDAETRRGLGFRNADEVAADRDARYGYLDRELAARDRQSMSNLEFLKDQLRQRTESEHAARELARQKLFIEDAAADLDRQLKGELGLGQLDVYKSQLEASKRPSEAFRLELLKSSVDSANRAKRAEALASEVNRLAATEGFDFWGLMEPTRNNYKAVAERMAADPLWKDAVRDIEFDPQSNRYVPVTPATLGAQSEAPGATDLLRALLNQANSGTNRSNGQTFTWSTNMNELVPVR